MPSENRIQEPSRGVASRNLAVGHEVLQEILSALEGLHFGSVEIVVHNSEVVQIERKEKFRFKQKDSIKKPGEIR